MRQVDPSDMPASARIQISIPAGPTTASAPVLSQKKRKAAQVAAQTETPGSQIALPASQPVRSLTQTMARETEEEAEQSGAYEEEPRDELYCVLNSKIVGVQYYTGMVGPGEEVNLIREPHNKYDRHVTHLILFFTMILTQEQKRNRGKKYRECSDRAYTTGSCQQDGSSHGQGANHGRGCYARGKS